jgi:hypothetical protein
MWMPFVLDHCVIATCKINHLTRAGSDRECIVKNYGRLVPIQAIAAREDMRYIIEARLTELMTPDGL